jgi:tetratricopeptide (TPR) repeat protein
MLPLRVVLDVACKLGVVAACCFGIEFSWKIASADLLFRHDDAEAVRAATRVEPDAWPYYVRLAQLDQGNARELLQKALALDPFDARADIDLGLAAEADGDFLSAEKYFKDAYSVDRTYLPRWSLANYYLRRDNLPEFWAWAERATEMPPDDVGLLFQICWRVEPAPAKIEARILHDDPELTRQFLGFLLARDQLPAVAALASHLLLIGDRGPGLPTLLQVVDRLVRAGDAASAAALWRQMMGRNWVFADTDVPYNSRFARDPLPVSFDWSITALSGVHSWTGQDGLETELTGSQPENCAIADQVVPLMPGAYHLLYSYRTRGILPGSGLRWQLLNVATGSSVTQSADLSSASLKWESFAFNIPPTQSLYRLRLVYVRTPGTARVSGTLVTASVRLLVDSQM